jgi:rod shape-determining protein MreC
MSSAGWLSGSLYETVDAVSGYFHLREVNDALSDENARLKNELARYRHQDDMAMVSAVDSLYLTAADTAYWQPYRYVSARIIQHSINKAQNYITINKGTEAGIRPDMGVVSAQGVVGIVKSVSKHYAVVMPLLNVQSRISCKLDSSKNFGSLIWDSADYRYATMQEVPGHVQVIPGETVSTSGFSAIFPAGIPVGKVVDVEINNENSFLEIQLELAVDFSKIDMVHVIQFGGRDELKNL